MDVDKIVKKRDALIVSLDKLEAQREQLTAQIIAHRGAVEVLEQLINEEAPVDGPEEYEDLPKGAD